MSGSYRRHQVSFYAEKNERKAQRNAVRALTGALDLPENEFLENFKISKEMVQYLCQELSQDLSPSTSQGLPVLVKVLCSIKVLLTGHYQRGVGQEQNVSIGQTTVSKFLKQFVVAVNTRLKPQWIVFPNTETGRQTVASGYLTKFGLPDVLGAIDCTHVQLFPPPKPQQAQFRNRHGITSINVQLICGLAKQLDMTERQVERWWRLRRSQDKPSTLVKFCENMWRTTFYLYNFSYGLFVLWDKDWLWDVDSCYIGYPHQGLTDDVWWYYMISAAFYWSLTISQFWDVRRKDFWQMFIHHIATILLLSFSWVCNLHRTGTIVLLVHDCADIFLDAAKAAKYANYQRLCDGIFVVFIVLWMTTRLYFYPFYIMWGTMIRAPMLVPMFPAYYIFNSLLCVLLVLHIIWTWLILQVAYKAISVGKMEGDIRSSSSEISDSSHQSNHSTPNRVNNKKDT